MGYIYKITNKVNGKIYIGQTSESVSQRWYEHKYSSEHVDNKGYHYALHCAIRKYGCDNFHVDTIEEIDNDSLNTREMYWIDFYDSYKSGYNMTLGGEGSRTLDYDLIYKLWDDGCGILKIANLCNCSDVQVREILKGYKNYSKQESNKRGARVFCKTVTQYDLNGKFIEKYQSATEASNITGVSVSNILAVCKFQQRTAGGWQWRFDGDSPLTDVYIGHERSVKQFYLDGTLKAKFASIGDAARSLNCSVSAISNACYGKTKSSHGYLWRLADDELNVLELNAKTRIRNKRVLQYTLNGEYVSIFDNISEAAAFMNVTYNSIYRVCIGKLKSSCGFIWKFE